MGEFDDIDAEWDDLLSVVEQLPTAPPPQEAPAPAFAPPPMAGRPDAEPVAEPQAADKATGDPQTDDVVEEDAPAAAEDVVTPEPDVEAVMVPAQPRRAGRRAEVGETADSPARAFPTWPLVAVAAVVVAAAVGYTALGGDDAPAKPRMATMHAAAPTGSDEDASRSEAKAERLANAKPGAYAPGPGFEGTKAAEAEPSAADEVLDARAETKAAVAAEADAADPADAEPDGSDVEPDGSDVEPDGSDVEPDGSDVEPDGSDVEPDGSDAEPEPEPDPDTLEDMPPPSLDPASIAKEEKAYAAAKNRWQETQANAQMEAMAIAACRMDDGAKARDAYRKLRGRNPRRRVFWTCRAAGVSLQYAEPGYSQAELIRRAAHKLAAGDAETALQWARDANRAARSDAAILIMGKAYCALGRVSRARKMLWHVNRGRKDELVAACREHGHDIEPSE